MARATSNTQLHLPIPDPLDLEATLFSGQAFRWRRRATHSYVGFIRNEPVQLIHQPRSLRVTSSNLTEEVLRHHFRLDESHERFLHDTPADPALQAALHTFPGLRILRQDPWEMAISFLISQNSNEAKIRKTIESLCRLAGTPVRFQQETLHRFPTPSQLAELGPERLRTTGMGYRARYVHSAALAVTEGRLRPEQLPLLPYEEAFQQLLELDGVGAKVADCILLYGCDHLNAFPTDVWVRRFVHETYLRRQRNPTADRIRTFAADHFGRFAGYAQHYLFHYRRTVGKLAKNNS